MSALPDILPEWVRAANPPAASAPPVVKVKWLRSFVASFARGLALDEIYGLDTGSSFSGEAETLLACIGMASQIGATRDEGILAARAEWALAIEAARTFNDELRRTIWPLGRDRASGPEIMARAEAVNRRNFDRRGTDLLPDDLFDVCQKIAVSAAARRRPHGTRS